MILLVASIVIIFSVIANKISNRIGLPVLLGFITLGMIFGEDGIFKIAFENYGSVEKITSTALIFIMFYGGFSTNFSYAKPILFNAIILSSLGVFFTAILVGSFSYFILKIDLLYSFLIGAIISSTDAASVFSILKSKRLSLKYRTDSLLEVESGSNDPASYMLTILFIGLINKNLDIASSFYLIFAQIVYAFITSFIISKIALFFLKRFKKEAEGFDSILVLAVGLLSYSLTNYIGGNGYLATYIVGIYLGNSDIKNKKNLVNFFDALTGLMQILIFFLLGLLSTPSHILAIIVPSTFIALFLTFIARPLSVYVLLKIKKAKLNQILLVSFAGLRGASSIVFATLATISIKDSIIDFYHIVFFIVLLSISFQGGLLGFVAKKLKMIDLSGNVMKTFSDYEEETDISFVEIFIDDKCHWCNKKIMDLSLPPFTLIVMIIRDSKRVVPRGDTLIIENDIIILSANRATDDIAVNIKELTIEKESPYKHKMIKELSFDSNEMIVLIKRDNKTIIPRGNTIILPNDIIVKSTTD